MANLLWQSADTNLDERIMQFLAGADVTLDQQLFVFDVQATTAHVRGLASINIVTSDECETLCNALGEIGEEFLRGDLIGMWMSLTKKP